MSELALVPCPFCGSTALGVEVADILSSWVTCLKCEAMGPSGESRAEAIAFWNERHMP